MPKDPRIPMSTIVEALAAAGIQGSKRSIFLAEIPKRMPKRGKPPEDDAVLIAKAERLVEGGAAKTLHAACVQISQGYINPKAVKKRIYEKAKLAEAKRAENARLQHAQFRAQLEERERVKPDRQVFVMQAVTVSVYGSMKQLTKNGIYSLPEDVARMLIALGIAEDHPKLNP